MSKSTISNFITLALSSIIANPVKLREVNQESVGFLELVEDVKRNGVVNPVTVRVVNTDLGEQYQLVDGLHRLTAARAAGLEEMNVQVVDVDDVGVLMMQISMNAHTIDTRPIEFTTALKQILSAKPFMTLAELGRDIGKSAAWIEQRLSLSNITNDVIKSLINEGKITLVNAYALAKLPIEEHADWMTQAQTESISEFAPKVDARVKEIKAAARQAREVAPQGFTPVAILRKFGELKKAPEDTQLLAQLATLAGSLEDAVKLGIQYAMNLDPLSVEAQKASYDNKKAAEAAAKVERAQKREAAAAAKSAEASAALGEEA